MKINIKATNFELTGAIKDYVEEKLFPIKKILPPQDESIMVDVEVAKINNHHQHGDVFKAEVNLHFAKRYLRAEAYHANLYGAIDEVRDEIERQVGNSLKKRETLFRRGGRAIKNFLHGVRSWPKNNKNQE